MIIDIFLFFIWDDYISNRDSIKSILIPKFKRITQPFSYSISQTTERKFTLSQIADIDEMNLLWRLVCFCVRESMCLLFLAYLFV